MAAIKQLPEARSVLILTPEKSENVRRATGNLQDVKAILASYANVRDLLKYDRVVIAADAVPVIERILALPEDAREPSVWKQARMAAAEEAAS
jgi:large subunit ribosomal protein L4